MKNRSGQVSVEFMLLLALVLIIFVPVIVIMSMSGVESADRINEEAISDTLVRIVDEARDTYYVGTFNKKTITVRMPRLERLSILNASSPMEGDKLYLEATYTSPDGERVVRRESEVPIATPCPGPEDVSGVCVAGYTCTRCEISGMRSNVEQDIELRTDGGPVVIRVI